MKFIPCDLETDGLLDEVTKIHCLGAMFGEEVRVTSDYQKIESFFKAGGYFVMHNGQCYDRPVIKKILKLNVPYAQIIDTMAISWALHPKRDSHGLASWGEELGVSKVAVDDSKWIEGGELMVQRVTEDVKIQSLLWSKFVGELNELYGEELNSNGEPKWLPYVRYLSFKMYVLSIQEKYPFKLDTPRCEANLELLSKLKEERTVALAAAMPKQGSFVKKTKPKNCFKKDFSHSSHGAAWFELLKSRGLPEDYDGVVEVEVGREEPNPSSPTQVKEWLFSLGWEPMTFKDGANGQVAQIKNGDDLCESVKALIKDNPAIEHLDKLGVLSHRIGLLKGFLRDNKGGYIAGRAHGFASTLRMRHAGIVNLPKPRIEYGDLIRGVLTCDEGYELCDSDLAALEDRIRLDLIYDLNPEKVAKKLHPDYDAHIDTAVVSSLMTPEDAEFFLAFKKDEAPHTEENKQRFLKLSDIRQQAKSTNYGSAYGIGAKKLAKQLGITVKAANKLLAAYWEINSEVKVVEQTWQTKKALGRNWIRNPYNNFWYELRSEKDKLSSIVQGGGDYVCYLWAKYVLEQREQVTLSYHDQLSFIVKNGHREEMQKILRNAIDKVNKTLKFKVPMDISINFGQYLNEVH